MFGLVVYEMLKGKHPFVAAQELDRLEELHATGRPDPVPGYLAKACVSKDPSERPASFQQASEVLGISKTESIYEKTGVEWNNQGTAATAIGDDLRASLDRA